MPDRYTPKSERFALAGGLLMVLVAVALGAWLVKLALEAAPAVPLGAEPQP